MSDDEKKSATLSEPQMVLMRILWAKPGATVIDVVEAMRNIRPLAHTTIATMLMRLEKRGLISSSRDGRQLLYSANFSETEVQRSMVDELLSSVFSGNAKALLNHLVREEEIKFEDLEQLRKRLKNAEKKEAVNE